MFNLIKLKELALDILFPPICLNCGANLAGKEKNNGICFACLSKIIVNTTLFCPVCRSRLPENKKICHRDSVYLLGATTNFDDLVRNLIHRLKYDSWRRLKASIEIILKIYLNNLASNIRTAEVQNLDDNSGAPDAQRLRKKTFKNYIVVPVPLHKNRERERGFNQAELIGKIIADYLDLPLEKDILFRVKETKTQAELKNREERKKNLSGAFKIENPIRVKGKNIIITDDVYTSGATINEAVKTLRVAGAKKIIALVLAKTK